MDEQSKAAMERKRPHPADDLDPDYEDVADQQNKRQRQVEHDGMFCQPVTSRREIYIFMCFFYNWIV